jgi:uncharacterized OB-fold protein
VNYKIYSYSVLRSTSLDFQDKLPYVVAILEDQEGKRRSEFLHGYADGMTVNVNDPVVAEIGADGAEVFRLAAKS